MFLIVLSLGKFFIFSKIVPKHCLIYVTFQWWLIDDYYVELSLLNVGSIDMVLFYTFHLMEQTCCVTIMSCLFFFRMIANGEKYGINFLKYVISVILF